MGTGSILLGTLSTRGLLLLPLRGSSSTGTALPSIKVGMDVTSRWLHTTTPCQEKGQGDKGKRRNHSQHSKIRKQSPIRVAKFAYGSTFRREPVVPLSPLATTQHPLSGFKVPY